MERLTDVLTIDICGIVIRFISQDPLRVTESLEHFTTDMDPEVEVKVCFGRKLCPVEKIASDSLLDYAYDGTMHYAVARLAGNVTMIATVYDDMFSNVIVWLNTDDFGDNLKQYSKILQHFPIRELLARFDAFILHSSRIALPTADTGVETTILFSAPSQTGKTTQAALWKEIMDARIVSNDSSVLRKRAYGIMTSGYPIDGSSPLYDPSCLPLGTVIILEQGKQNIVRRLQPFRAILYLMKQTSLDIWNAQELSKIQLLWADILRNYPVYLYACRPDESAVYFLRDFLTQNGGIHFAKPYTYETGKKSVRRTDAIDGVF